MLANAYQSNNEAGDTIIEVLVAITVFCLVAVGGLSIMNQGTAMAQRALEISLVRQQIDAQADALRFLNQAYVADYGKRGTATDRWHQLIEQHTVGQAQDFSTMVNGDKCRLPDSGDMFALDVSRLETAAYIVPQADAATYAKVRYETNPATAQGIWIQAVPSTATPDNKPGFYDFHIGACWNSPGQTTPVTLGTIVRLYDPRG